MKILPFYLLFFFGSLLAQDSAYNVFQIPKDLKEHANAVIRLSETAVEIQSQDLLVIKERKVITVLNENADYFAELSANYNIDTKINELEVRVLDALGHEIAKIKKNKFEDVSAVGGGTLYSDERAKYYRYIPKTYPYTIEIVKEIATNTTAFIKPFVPVEHYLVSVEAKTFTIHNKTNINLKKLALNFDGFTVDTSEVGNVITYKVNNLKAERNEVLSPYFATINPIVYFSLEDFTMKGVSGENKDWSSFGKWMHDKLIQDVVQLPEEAIQEVKALINPNDDVLTKARKVYEYMQNKTRYVNVAIGIGGWKPDNATNVHKLGYGDCKGLTNYTKAMLDQIGVTSYHTIVYSGAKKVDINKDFSGTQGNHMILNIPNNGDDVWLECTSQTVPFGYIANFTDDRNVLVIRPDGGIIKKTKKYSAEENKRTQFAEVNLREDGSFEAQLTINATGLHYGNRFSILFEAEKDQKIAYKNEFGYLNDLEVTALRFSDNKEAVHFVENISLACGSYAQKAGDKLLLAANLFHRYPSIPPSYKERKNSFQLQRGYINEDEYIINIPQNMKIEAYPENLVLENEFGVYSVSIEILNDQQLKYKRFLRMNEGIFDKEKYNEYRSFIKKIIRKDKSKMVVTIK